MSQQTRLNAGTLPYVVSILSCQALLKQSVHEFIWWHIPSRASLKPSLEESHKLIGSAVFLCCRRAACVKTKSLRLFSSNVVTICPIIAFTGQPHSASNLCCCGDASPTKKPGQAPKYGHFLQYSIWRCWVCSMARRRLCDVRIVPNPSCTKSPYLYSPPYASPCP